MQTDTLLYLGAGWYVEPPTFTERAEYGCCFPHLELCGYVGGPGERLLTALFRYRERLDRFYDADGHLN